MSENIVKYLAPMGSTLREFDKLVDLTLAMENYHGYGGVEGKFVWVLYSDFRIEKKKITPAGYTLENP